MTLSIFFLLLLQIELIFKRPMGSVGVTQAGSVNISSSIHLKNCLLIPSLSHKLLSISQLTKELNCTVLFTLDGCIV